jgi:hypothetical protein
MKTPDSGFIPLPDPKAGLFTSIDVIKERARACRDDAYCRRLYRLQLAAAGFPQFSDASMPLPTAAGTADPDLIDFPEIEPALIADGIQNHVFQDNRIVASQVAFAHPEFVFNVDNPTIKEVCVEHIKDLWETGQWGNVLFESALDVQVLGIGLLECFTEGGTTGIERRSPLDCMWDRLIKDPNKWRYYFRRRRLDLSMAMETYGHLFTEERLKQMMRPVSLQVSGNGPTNAIDFEVLYEWAYWDHKTYVVFLGGIQNGEIVSLDQNLQFSKGGPGPNPYGILPIVPWIETFMPGQRRPVSKSEYIAPIARKLNNLEQMFSEITERGIPFTAVSSIGLDPEVIEDLKNCKGVKDIARVLCMDVEDVEKVLARIPALDIPPTLFNYRSLLKGELNESSGVVDAQRGQMLDGDNTAYEVRQFYDASGAQARHTKRQYANALERLAMTVRAIEASYGWSRRLLNLSGGIVDTRYFPLQPFLKLPVRVHVLESSINVESEEQRVQRRMLQFQTIDMAGIQLGVNDKFKTFYSVYRDIGVKDPYERMMTVAQAQAYADQQLQAQLQQMAMANAPQQGNSGGTAKGDNASANPE